MTDSKDLIIISASCGKNLELSKQFQEKSNELQFNSEILDLTTFDIPLFNPRIHTKANIPKEIVAIKEKLFATEKWIICAPEYNRFDTSNSFKFNSMAFRLRGRF